VSHSLASVVELDTASGRKVDSEQSSTARASAGSIVCLGDQERSLSFQYAFGIDGQHNIDSKRDSFRLAPKLGDLYEAARHAQQADAPITIGA